MMEAARISETSVNFYQTFTWRNTPEDNHLQTSSCLSVYTKFHRIDPILEDV
jgi:hypothetical protein